MAASSRVPQPFLQPVNGSGVPYPGAKLIAYQANTTTPQDTYTTAALAVENANPVIADGDGRFPPIFLGDGLTYDLILKDANDTVIWTAEDVAALSSSSATTTTAGSVELATNAEALVGTDTSRVPPVSAAVQMILQGFAYAAAGGTANALTGTPSITPVALANGMEVIIRATATNNNATTLNWAGTGVVTVKKLSDAGATALIGGEIVSGNLYRFVYSGADSCWIVEPVGPAPITGTLVNSGDADYTVTDANRNGVVRFASLTADRTLNLPAASGRAGFRFSLVLDDDTYGVTVDGNSAETVDGQATRKTFGRTRIEFFCNGTAWFSIGGIWIFVTTATWASAGSIDTAHGQPSLPKRVFCYIKCLTTDGGYAVGDQIMWTIDASSGVSANGTAWGASATNVFYKQGSAATTSNVPRKDTGANFQPVFANWQVVLVAEFN